MVCYNDRLNSDVVSVGKTNRIKVMSHAFLNREQRGKCNAEVSMMDREKS